MNLEKRKVYSVQEWFELSNEPSYSAPVYIKEFDKVVLPPLQKRVHKKRKPNTTQSNQQEELNECAKQNDEILFDPNDLMQPWSQSLCDDLEKRVYWKVKTRINNSIYPMNLQWQEIDLIIVWC